MWHHGLIGWAIWPARRLVCLLFAHAAEEVHENDHNFYCRVGFCQALYKHVWHCQRCGATSGHLYSGYIIEAQRARAERKKEAA